MFPCGTSFIQGHFPPISGYFWIQGHHGPTCWKHVPQQGEGFSPPWGPHSGRGAAGGEKSLVRRPWGSWTLTGTGMCPAWLGTAWLPVTSDSVHYFCTSKGRKIRDTNLHTPLRGTIKRAEDILERLQILLCPALSTVGCLQNMLHVLLAYTPVLIYGVTLVSYHRAMTQFKQNFQRLEPAAPLCHLFLSTFVPALPRSLNADDTTLGVFLTSPSLQSWAALNGCIKSHQNWRGAWGWLVTAAPQRNLSPLPFPPWE